MQVGVRELQNRTSKVLREVTENRQSVDITRRGRVIARLVPVSEGGPTEVDLSEFERVWCDMHRLAEEIGARWPADLSAADAVSMDRR